MNEYFLTVFTQENLHDKPDSEQIFVAEESEKLIDIPITKEMIEQEIDRLKNSNHQDPMKYIQEYLRNAKRLLVNHKQQSLECH